MPELMKYLRGNCEIEVSDSLKTNDITTLIILTLHPGKGLTYYSNIVGLKPGSFTYLSNKLEKKGYVNKINDSNDDRKTQLIITEKGKKIAERIMKKYDKYTVNKLSVLEEEEVENFSFALKILERTLIKLKDNI